MTVSYDPSDATIRARVWVSGRVQGVGFRPFVWRAATSRGLSGWVGNDALGVVLEVEGRGSAVAALLAELHSPPPLALVDQIRSESMDTLGGGTFEIRKSVIGGARQALVAPDTATCTDCLRELHDPDDRRFGHPFVNCTSCGPRYTIVESVPYDRSRTTMGAFVMCRDCTREYEDPTDRRFHAEPVCCPRCGPTLRLDGSAGNGSAAVAEAVALLRAGSVVAVKGLGGYHLCADATLEPAVGALRRRKHREDRPFAVMVADLAAASRLCELNPLESELLASPARPIVVLRRRPAGAVADSVAPGSPTLGLMLPYTPLHALLLEAYDGPLVLTSGNASDEPIAFDDADALRRLGTIADAFLVHDRVIRTRVDDSVVKVVSGRVLPLRRSRGYVPAPIPLTRSTAKSVLACGAALKNTFCLTRGSQAFVSHHVGDLGDYKTMRSYLQGIEHLKNLLDIAPTVLAHDLHPDYPSTQYAMDTPGVQLIGVQHHHAHVASCLADNGEQGPVIGVAFDGLGLGDDGRAWGGEFMVADLTGYERVGHLREVPMPGGDAATRQPWRMAAAHLDAAYEGAPPAGLSVAVRQGDRWDHVLAAKRAGLNSPLTSSMGRLFDAVAAIVGVRDAVTYEGQAAIELEHLADTTEAGTYPVPLGTGAVDEIDVSFLVRAVTEDVLRGTPASVVAGRFHHAIADLVRDVCVRLRESSALPTVALSGGVFQNALLVSRCLDRLESAGFVVLTHRQVPPNDGGLSLGQAAVAAARLTRD